jgi:hypothetical protein
MEGNISYKSRPAFPALGGRMNPEDSINLNLLDDDLYSPDEKANGQKISPPFSVIDRAQGIYEYPALMTLANYVSLGYVGWRGTNRWMVVNPKIVDSNVGDDKGVCNPTTIVYRDTSPNFINTMFTVPTNPANPNFVEIDGVAINSAPITPALVTDTYRNYPVTGWSGANIATQSEEVVEFEVPFYSKYRFSPAKTSYYRNKASQYPNSSPNQNLNEFPGYTILTPASRTDASGIQSFYHCVGEDFQVYWYTGPPVFKFYDLATIEDQ